jgi:CheY-like chemotaxis protein
MSKAKILIVDDDARLSNLMRAILVRGGYETREENRSFAALTAAREFRPDLILLDVDMPGKDGGTVAAELRMDAALARTPIIFVTSLIAKTEAGMRGGERFLAKPVAPADLLGAVNEMLPKLAA